MIRSATPRATAARASRAGSYERFPDPRNLDTPGDRPHVAGMSGRPDRKEEGGKGARPAGKRAEKRVARNATSKAYMNLAAALAAVFTAGFYTRQDLQRAGGTFVSQVKEGG